MVLGIDLDWHKPSNICGIQSEMTELFQASGLNRVNSSIQFCRIIDIFKNYEARCINTGGKSIVRGSNIGGRYDSSIFIMLKELDTCFLKLSIGNRVDRLFSKSISKQVNLTNSKWSGFSVVVDEETALFIIKTLLISVKSKDNVHILP